MNYFTVPGLKNPDAFAMTTQRIIKAVCEHFELSLEAMQARTRKREIVIARQVAFYFLRNHTHMSLKSIGIMFGKLDHTSVLHGLRTVEDLRPRDEKLKEAIKMISFKLYI